MRQTGALRTELKIKETNVYYPAFSKLLVTLPIASSTISSMAAYVLRVLSSMKLYLSMYFWGAWTGSWTFWNGKYRKRDLEELCSLTTWTACCVLEVRYKRCKRACLYLPQFELCTLNYLVIRSGKWNAYTAISRKVVGKMCTRQSRKVMWDMINTLFLTTVPVEPTFVAFL